MSHATEGDLHAYLDGALASIEPGAVERLDAHLAHCADCRARLSQERQVRDRAGALLGAALPAVPTPPFETTVGRVAPYRNQWLSSERLAWAAAVVIALGAGWMGSALLRESPDSLMTPLSSAFQEADSDATAGVDQAVENVAAEPPGAVGKVADAAPPAEQVQARREATDDRSEEAGGANRIDDAPATPRAATAEIQTGPPMEERFADESVASGQRENEGLSSLLESTDAMDWQTTDEDGAEAWLGRSPLRVENLEVLSYESGARGAARLVRVQQQLTGGETLILIQETAVVAEDLVVGRAIDRAAASAPEPEPSVAGDRDQVRRDRASQTTTLARNLVDGVWVTLQAPLASDSLRVLLSLIRQPQR